MEERTHNTYVNLLSLSISDWNQESNGSWKGKAFLRMNSVKTPKIKQQAIVVLIIQNQNEGKESEAMNKPIGIDGRD